MPAARVPERFAFGPVLLLALLGAASIPYTTRWGIGLSPDSAAYIGSARSLLADGRLAVPSGRPGEPLTHFPPLYPSLLAASAAIFRVDPIDSARWCNAALFGANIFLIGLLVFQETLSSRAAFSGAGIALFLTDLLNVHTMAWSEPLFVACMLLGLLGFTVWGRTGRFLFLALTGVAAAAAWITRYAGVSFVAACVAAFMEHRGGPRERRTRDLVVLCGLACLPMAVWTLRNLTLTGNPVARSVAFHPVSGEHLLRVLDQVSQWFLPGSIALPLRAAGLAVLLATALVAWSRRRTTDASERSQHTLRRLLTRFVAFYLLSLAVSISFFDAGTELDGRILLPVLVSLLILGVYFVNRWWRAGPSGLRWRAPAVALCALFVLIHVRRGLQSTAVFMADGRGYAARAWRDSPLLQRLSDLSPSQVIYANVPDAVYLLSGRGARWLPEKINPVTLRVNENYPRELAALSTPAASTTVILYARSVTYRWFLPSEGELLEALPLNLLVSTTDGAIYRPAAGTLTEAGGMRECRP